MISVSNALRKFEESLYFINHFFSLKYLILSSGTKHSHLFSAYDGEAGEDLFADFQRVHINGRFSPFGEGIFGPRRNIDGNPIEDEDRIRDEMGNGLDFEPPEEEQPMLDGNHWLIDWSDWLWLIDLVDWLIDLIEFWLPFFHFLNDFRFYCPFFQLWMGKRGQCSQKIAPWRPSPIRPSLWPRSGKVRCRNLLLTLLFLFFDVLSEFVSE